MEVLAYLVGLVVLVPVLWVLVKVLTSFFD
jgi:hypothetical protein